MATQPPLADTSDISPISIVDEMKASYLDYAMSVIVSRALPEVRDGLSPSTAASSTRARSRASSPGAFPDFSHVQAVLK